MPRTLADIEVVGNGLGQHRGGVVDLGAQGGAVVGRHLHEMVALAAVRPGRLMKLLVGAAITDLRPRQHDDADIGIDQMFALQTQAVLYDEEMIRHPGTVRHRRQRVACESR